MKRLLILITALNMIWFASCNDPKSSSEPASTDTTNKITGHVPVPASVTGRFSGSIPCNCPGINMSLTLGDTMFTAVVNFKGQRKKGKSFSVFTGHVSQDSGKVTLENKEVPAANFKIISVDSLEVISLIKNKDPQYLVRGKHL